MEFTGDIHLYPMWSGTGRRASSLANTGWNIRSSRSLSTIDLSSPSNHISLSFSSSLTRVPFAHPHTFFCKHTQISNMQFFILFTSFFAGVLALPVPQVGVSQSTPASSPDQRHEWSLTLNRPALAMLCPESHRARIPSSPAVPTTQ